MVEFLEVPKAETQARYLTANWGSKGGQNRRIQRGLRQRCEPEEKERKEKKKMEETKGGREIVADKTFI